MATNSDLISMTKALVHLLEEATKGPDSNSHSGEASSSESSIFREEKMSRGTLEDTMEGLASLIEVQCKETKELVSRRLKRLEERFKSLEDVLTARFGLLDTKMTSVSKEIKSVSDKLERRARTAQESEEKLSLSEGGKYPSDKTSKEDVDLMKESQTATHGNESAAGETKISPERRFVEEEDWLMVPSEDCKLGDKSSSALYMRRGGPSNGVQRFHSDYKGKNVELGNSFKTAKRIKPLDDSGTHGSVLSDKPLGVGEGFSFRIEEATECFEGDYGIAIGVILMSGNIRERRINEHRSIFYNFKGTWAIRSQSSSIRGYSNLYKDGDLVNNNGYRLDTRHLPVGSVIGVSRSDNGDVHFHLNGIDYGPAFQDVPEDVHAFLDIMYYVTKISVVD